MKKTFLISIMPMAVLGLFITACGPKEAPAAEQSQAPSAAQEPKPRLAHVMQENSSVSKLQPGTGTQYYAAPNGTAAGDGSMEKPWDLVTALGSKTIKPGDTLWLRGGTYKSSAHCTLHGENDKPIMVAQCPGERATLTGRLQITAPAAHTWFWDFELSSDSKTRNSKENVSWPPGDLPSSGIDIMDNSTVEGPGLKFINLVIHDTNSSGINLWHQAIEAEVYGCVVYYNGWQGPAGDRNHGHGLYAQNKTGIKRISDNIFFKHFMFGTQLYGSGQAFVDNFDYVGNILFNNGAVGGKLEINLMVSPENCQDWHFNISDNHLYQSDLGRTNACIGYPWHKKPYETFTVNNNRFVGTTYLYWVKNLQAKGNMFLGKVEEVDLPEANMVCAKFDRETNKFLQEKPKGLQSIVVRPSAYTAGRANIVIYNWDLKDAVNVMLDNVLARGQAYEVRDAQNFFGEPVAKGVFDGKPVAIRMKGLTVADPVGIAPDPLLKHTAPEFGVFVVMPIPGPAAKPAPAVPAVRGAPSR